MKSSNIHSISAFASIMAPLVAACGPGQFALNLAGNFKAGDGSDLWYTTNGGWPVSSGSLASKSQFCLDYKGSGGRMSIGKQPPGGTAAQGGIPGNSIIECYWPGSGQGNCDISFVDGFSVPISCTLANGGKWSNGQSSLGCTADILSQCTNSAAASLDKANAICHNTNGAHGSTAISQQAPWKACPVGSSEVWFGDQGDYTIGSPATNNVPSLFPVTCNIGTASFPGASKREAEAEADPEPEPEAHVHSHAERHMRKARRHALGLKDIVDAVKP